MPYNVLPVKYSSDSEAESNYVHKYEAKPRMPKRKRDWRLEKTFSSQAEALSYINEEQTWSFHYRNKTDDGNKYYYRCNKAKKYGKQCAQGIYLLYNRRDTSIELYRTETAHDHENIQSTNVRLLSQTAKEHAKELFENDNRVKPTKMLAYLMEKGYDVTINQVKKYLADLQKTNQR